MSYYPVFLEMAGRSSIVIGGGAVAERKVRQLLECGATVTVVAKDVSASLNEMANDGRISLICRRYEKGDLSGAFLAIAATDDREVNEGVAGEAREQGILVNIADAPDMCDFIAPAVIRRGDLVVAISTGGLSPALARRVREELETMLGPEYEQLALLLGVVRRELRQQGVAVESDRWQKAVDSDLRALLRRGDLAAAKEMLLARLVGVASTG
ncbi:MAG: bifunctional precorrin-2 dehydrogenase/sirohydrochlorin ferrochelatase [Chloroflexi bacterium]|nr:bifunctional precorrin-2 dehydrogenase/sirohydrochlorin ferrochelatase [Chloroflexota bacterium]